ncbi:tetratricopeptide repeat protein [Candidatus Latescibacterota bacterium]
MKIKWFIPCLAFVLVLIMYAAKQSEGTVEVTGGSAGGIVVTLTEPDRSLLEEGDGLRKARKFDEAVVSYERVLANKMAAVEIKKEAQYNIGLCKIERGNYDDAVTLYSGMLNTYANDGDATAHIHYCLAWIEVQREQFDSAIARLERTLEEKKCTDRELCAKMQFMIGRIYLMFKIDYEKAKAVFKEINNKYPETKISQHPYLQ